MQINRTRLPLPEPARVAPVLGVIRNLYTADQMHAYSDAENAGLRERVKVLEDALQHIERVMGPKVPPCCDGCNFEWDEALKTVRAALEAK